MREAGALEFRVPGMAVVPSPTADDVVTALESGPVVFSVRLRAGRDQHGPARVLTLSEGVQAQDLMVGQEGAAVVVRVRRDGSTALGTPPLVAEDVLGDGATHDVEVRIGRRAVRLVIDGTVAAEQPVDGLTRTWDADHTLVLGNEHGGTRPWRGIITEATVSTAGGRTDLVAASVLPERFWQQPDRWAGQPAWYAPWAPQTSQVLHAAAFLAIGWLAMRGLRRGPVRTWWLCTGFSASMLALKFFVGGRHPSVADTLVEVVAAGVGIALAVVARRRTDEGVVVRP